MLSIGIIGLPNVGKSTLFNALTDAQALAANYPFATIEPNTGIVPIPDPRLKKLAQLYAQPGTSHLSGVRGAGEQRTEAYLKYAEGAAPPATPQSAKSASGVTGSAGQQAGALRMPRIVPATVTFVDIAGLVAGASKGEGLGNQFLAHIRSTKAIAHLVRAFSDPNVIHVSDGSSPKTLGLDGVRGAGEQRTEAYLKYAEGAAQPATPQSAKSASGAANSVSRQAGTAQCLSDIEIINTELALADLQTIESRLPRLEKEARADPKLKPVLETLHEVKALLEAGKPLNSAENIDFARIADLQLISAKPIIYVFNMDEKKLADNTYKKQLAELVKPADAVFISAKLESELRGLDAADRQELLASYGQDEDGLSQLIDAAYDTLGLQSFLTAGEKEVRAWTIKKGSTAPQAAGTIHTDFERGFIAAQVVDYSDLITAGSEAAAKAAGKIRTEGKTYVMQPDDVVEFRFNV